MLLGGSCVVPRCGIITMEERGGLYDMSSWCTTSSKDGMALITVKTGTKHH